MREWIDIKKAPKSLGTVIDIWSSRHGRCTNYYRAKHGAYWPAESGISVIRDATHWMPLPESPELLNE